MLCVAVSAAMWIFRPVPHGHRYGLAIELAAALFLVWLFGRVPADRIFRTGALAVILAIGLAWGVRSFTTIDPQAEIVGVYQSVFEALDSGRNPYTCGTIYHRDENGAVVYGNFNYPPAEIGPYYLAYRLLGRWDSAVLTAVMLALNALGCLLLLATFPALPAAKLAAFFPIFLFGEIKTNPSMTFLVAAALLCLMVRDQRAPRPGRRLLIAAVFGVGLLTKFLIMPLMAAYYWRRFDRKRPASLGPLAAGGAIALAVSALLMAPFGIGAVLKNTLLFNAVLKDREALTTFYPNVLSGPLEALGLGMIYPFLALAAMGVAILVAPRLRLLPALLTACFVFLLAAPTPEPQYLPIIVYAALAWRCLEMKERPPAGPAAAETGRG